MAIHSSVLAWRIPWTKEPRGYSPQSHTVLERTEATKHACNQKYGSTSVSQAEIQGWTRLSSYLEILRNNHIHACMGTDRVLFL